MLGFTVCVGASVVLRELLPTGRYSWRAIAILTCSPKAMTFRWKGKTYQVDKGETIAMNFNGNLVVMKYSRSHGEAVQLTFECCPQVKVQRDGFQGPMRG